MHGPGCEPQIPGFLLLVTSGNAGKGEQVTDVGKDKWWASPSVLPEALGSLHTTVSGENNGNGSHQGLRVLPHCIHRTILIFRGTIIILIL